MILLDNNDNVFVTESDPMYLSMGHVPYKYTKCNLTNPNIHSKRPAVYYQILGLCKRSMTPKCLCQLIYGDDLKHDISNQLRMLVGYGLLSKDENGRYKITNNGLWYLRMVRDSNFKKFRVIETFSTGNYKWDLCDVRLFIEKLDEGEKDDYIELNNTGFNWVIMNVSNRIDSLGVDVFDATGGELGIAFGNPDTKGLIQYSNLVQVLNKY